MEFADLRWRRTGLTLAVRRCEIFDGICRLLRATHPTTEEIQLVQAGFVFVDAVSTAGFLTHSQRQDSRFPTINLARAKG